MKGFEEQKMAMARAGDVARVGVVPAGTLEKAADWLVGNFLPLGWIALSTGMFWIGDRARYHQLYYVLLLTPAVLAVFLYPARLKTLLASPLLIFFILFGAYAILSIAWSNSDHSAFSLAKRPFYVLFLFFSGGLLALKSPKRLLFSLKASAIIASLLGAVSLAFYMCDGIPDRLSGYGALHNPLLSSHVYGYFMAFWLADWFLRKNPVTPISLFSGLVFGALIIATGSRTPLLALAACSVWLMVAHWNRRSLVLLMLMILTLGAFLIFYPEGLFSRGTSLRPEIWEEVWQQILDTPWFGHGYDASMRIRVPAAATFSDPHNLSLGVFHNLGMIGLALWFSLYISALVFSWRNRKEPLVMMASALLVFGLAASMTEGGSFLSRPTEHWFLLWIPMALLFSAELMLRKRGRPHAP
ncbi:MAG: O-antigen ligase family protein [Zoogloeaceae bacterium]|jgi:O-antigen ligase|nr:O-antigen ligase family protein [Zoogloeaceae bacterium]